MLYLYDIIIKSQLKPKPNEINVFSYGKFIRENPKQPEMKEEKLLKNF